MRAPGTGAAARILLALAGALVLSLATPAAQAIPRAATASVSPSGTATLRGVLLLGDPAVPVAGAKVTIHGVADGADPLTLAATTDAKGRFVFGALAGGDAWTYTVTAQHQGTQFSTDVLTVKSGATVTTTLQTYDVTADPAGIVWPEWLVWLDVEGSTLAVQQDVSMKNTGGRAYIGTEPVQGAPDGGRAAVSLPVVPGASSLSYLGAFEVCCDAVSGSTWVHTRPVPPGTTTGTLRYEAPLPTSLAFPVARQTESFSVLVPSGTEVSSSQLTPAGTQTDRGTTYQVLKGGPFAAGTTITVTLGSAGAGSSAPLIAAGAGLLVVVGVLVWWLLRRRRTAAARAAQPGRPASLKPPKPASPRQTAPKPAPSKRAPSKPAASKPEPSKPAASKPAKPAPKAASTASASTSAASPSAAAPAGAGRTHDDADVLADELAMLDLAHESGSLPDEESYQRVRASLVDRLVAALGEDPDALSR